MSHLSDDAIALLSEYRRLYAEHWATTQGARYLVPAREPDVYERVQFLRGETTRILPAVEAHLRSVGIDISQVSGGVRPAVVDRVIDVAIELHQQRQELDAAATLEASPRPEGDLRRRAMVALLALLSAGGAGWGLVAGGWF